MILAETTNIVLLEEIGGKVCMLLRVIILQWLHVLVNRR